MFGNFTAHAMKPVTAVAALLFACVSAQAASVPGTAASAQSPAANPQPPAGDCNRSCLQQALDTYLGAVFKHDVGAARLTEDHFATENTVVVHNGEGFWKDVSGYGEVQRRYFDPVNETAAFFGLLKRNGQDMVVSVRIRVEGQKVSEAEWIVTNPGPAGAGVASPEGLVAQPPPTPAMVPSSERSSRFMMVALVNNYLQSNKGHDGSWIPTDPSCIKIEGGRSTGGAAKQGYCTTGFTGSYKTTFDLAQRRFLVIDEEAGVILASAIFVRYPESGRQDNLVHEYFMIHNDKIYGIWSSFYYLPLGSPALTGWEKVLGFYR
jgi:hypothetical protein